MKSPAHVPPDEKHAFLFHQPFKFSYVTNKSRRRSILLQFLQEMRQLTQMTAQPGAGTFEVGILSLKIIYSLRRGVGYKKLLMADRKLGQEQSHLQHLVNRICQQARLIGLGMLEDISITLDIHKNSFIFAAVWGNQPTNIGGSRRGVFHRWMVGANLGPFDFFAGLPRVMSLPLSFLA